jgi:hypothetical protein
MKHVPLVAVVVLLKRIKPQWPVRVSLQRLGGLPRIFCLSDDRSLFVEEFDSGPFFARGVSSYSFVGFCVLALN